MGTPWTPQEPAKILRGAWGVSPRIGPFTTRRSTLQPDGLLYNQKKPYEGQMGHFTTEMGHFTTEMGHFVTQMGHFTTDVTYAVGPPQRKQMACFLDNTGMDP